MRAFRLPRLRKRLWLAIVGLATLELVAIILLVPVHPLLAAVAGALGTLGAGFVIDRHIGRPLVATERGAGIIATSNPGHRVEINGNHWLGRLPETVEKLGGAVARSRRELEEAAAAWTTRIEARKTRLETILREIREGVLVCGPDGRISLYNRTARELLSAEPALGLGRNINEVLNEGPLRHTLRLLEPGEGGTEAAADAELVCATASGERLLRCRVARLVTDDPDTAGFVMTLQDVSRQTRSALRREQSLREAVEALRNPLTSLNTASESLRLAQAADMAEDAARFSDMVCEETQRLTAGFKALSTETMSVVTDNWRLEDVHLGSLVDGIKQTGDSAALPRIQCRADVWVSAEPYLLSQVVEALMARLVTDLGVSAVALSGREEGSLVYLEMNCRVTSLHRISSMNGWMPASKTWVGPSRCARSCSDMTRRHGASRICHAPVERFCGCRCRARQKRCAPPKSSRRVRSSMISLSRIRNPFARWARRPKRAWQAWITWSSTVRRQGSPQARATRSFPLGRSAFTVAR
ncbi:PAS domain-containing protein [Spiribacter insolitus]|uniref:PAS domain-containing protein n=1 Tax=Spiribacter insolitus TaxID=3122417 RepID=A0ABV3T953_9GAMM